MCSVKSLHASHTALAALASCAGFEEGEEDEEEDVPEAHGVDESDVVRHMEWMRCRRGMSMVGILLKPCGKKMEKGSCMNT